MARCAGMEDPPFMEAFMDELEGPIILEEDPQTSSAAELQRWAEAANALLGRRGG